MSDLSLTRGDDEELTVTVTTPIVDADAHTPDDPAWTPTYGPVDISSMDGDWMMKRNRDDADDDALLAKVTSTDIDVTTAGEDGVATVTIGATDLDDVAPGVYFWEFQGIIAGEVRTLASGRIRVVGDIVRETTPGS